MSLRSGRKKRRDLWRAIRAAGKLGPELLPEDARWELVRAGLADLEQQDREAEGREGRG